MARRTPKGLTAMDSDEVDRSKMGEGRYANYAEIGHSEYEFVFDFGQAWMYGDPAKVYVRVVTSPETAARLQGALDNALSNYRDSFGDIRYDSQTPDKKES
jgi:hypothetical protein